MVNEGERKESHTVCCDSVRAGDSIASGVAQTIHPALSISHGHLIARDMRRSGILSLFLCLGACNSLPDQAIKKHASFSEADTKYVTGMVLDYVIEHMPSQVCLKTPFRTDTIALKSAGVLHTDPMPDIVEIPPDWVPSQARLCRTNDNTRPTVQIGRPTFARVKIKNETIDIADAPVRFACGAGHLCSETSALTYSRRNGSKWKFEEYRRNSVGM